MVSICRFAVETSVSFSYRKRVDQGNNKEKQVKKCVKCSKETEGSNGSNIDVDRVKYKIVCTLI